MLNELKGYIKLPESAPSAAEIKTSVSKKQTVGVF